MAQTIDLDVVIFGGGAAGLWLLDELHRSGRQCMLIESGSLGQGQTVASQGIIHGGVKYALAGPLRDGFAEAIRDMPRHWLRCLIGDARPHLGVTRSRAASMHLWTTPEHASTPDPTPFAANLLVPPRKLDAPPHPLFADAAAVYQLDEPIVDTVSLLQDLGHQGRFRIVQATNDQVGLEQASDGSVTAIHLHGHADAPSLRLTPRAVVLAAGSGNHMLRERLGLPVCRGQSRPLHTPMVKGNLPMLNGHCIDGSIPRLTITSDRLDEHTVAWQLGGDVAERGVDQTEDQLITAAAAELKAVMPGLDQTGLQWATYRVDRAEAAAPGAHRPDDAVAVREANIISAWPTKLCLVPRLVAHVFAALDDPADLPVAPTQLWSDWPKPNIAPTPWAATTDWRTR